MSAVQRTDRTLDVHGQTPYNVRMAKDERFESRLSAEGRAALEKIAAHYGISRAAVIEMTLREHERRIAGLESGEHSGRGERRKLEQELIDPDPEAEQEVKEQRKKKKAARTQRKRALSASVRNALPEPDRREVSETKVDAQVRPHSFHSGVSPVANCKECAKLAKAEKAK